MKTILFLFLLLPLSLFARTVDLVRDGKPVSAIIVIDGVEEPYHFPQRTKEIFSPSAAAAELVEYLKKMSHADVPIHRVEAKGVPAAMEEIRKQGGIPILIGPSADGVLKATSPEEKSALEDKSGFLLNVTPERVAITGSTHAGTTFGVYELLEQLGVRWFFPGELGTVIPTQADVKLPVQTLASRPSLASRYFPVEGADEWNRHQRMGGLFFPPAHGIRLGREISFKTNPEYYALINNERVPRQLCVSNPEVVKLAAKQAKVYFRASPQAPWIGMGPNDGDGFCECAKCRALDGGEWDAFSGDASMTDRYIWFFNQVLAEISDEFPDKMIAFYAYHTYMRPPVKVRPDPRIAAALAPIALCRIHSVDNPVCPERDYVKMLVQEWSRQLPNLYERGYWFNLADPGMLFSQVHKLRREIPFYAEQGCKGFRVECLGHWAVEGPSLYVAGKLLWNHHADPDALIKDFCEKLFGPAAVAMERYFQAIEDRLFHADHHAGSAFEVTHIYPKDFRDSLAGHLEEARHLAKESPFRERVALYSDGFLHSEALAKMIEARDRHDWQRAAEELARLDEVQGRLIASDPPMLNPKGSPMYLKRFFRLPVEQGAARVRDGNTMAVPLSNQWQFLADPQGVGADLHYERPELTGGNWQTIDATTTWSENGLRYYKGLSWYRQKVKVPGAFKGKRLFLWFGGVDEAARVWVNGKLVGTSPSSAFTPFEVDVTEAVQAGEENRVVLCVANQRVDELGTGGVTAPAFIYAPAGGMEATLENVRPLRDTFP